MSSLELFFIQVRAGFTERPQLPMLVSAVGSGFGAQRSLTLSISAWTIAPLASVHGLAYLQEHSKLGAEVIPDHTLVETKRRSLPYRDEESIGMQKRSPIDKGFIS